jgi:hypothetical protein
LKHSSGKPPTLGDGRAPGAMVRSSR